MSIYIVIALLALGSCTGFLAGLLGIGGGMIITPFLTMLLVSTGVPADHIVHVSIATSLATILFTSLSSVRAHHKRGAVMWKVVGYITPGILLGALVGTKISSLLSTCALSLVFAGFVGFSAYKMFSKSKPKPSRELPGAPGLFGVGSVIGSISALVGAGGGFITVPFMLWCNTKIHNAVATSAALGFPIAAFGTIGYVLMGMDVKGLEDVPYMLGYIHLPALLSVSLSSILTAPLGARVAHSIDTRPLQRIFACNLLVLGSYMFYRALQAF